MIKSAGCSLIFITFAKAYSLDFTCRLTLSWHKSYFRIITCYVNNKESRCINRMYINESLLYVTTFFLRTNMTKPQDGFLCDFCMYVLVHSIWFHYKKDYVLSRNGNKMPNTYGKCSILRHVSTVVFHKDDIFSFIQQTKS